MSTFQLVTDEDAETISRWNSLAPHPLQTWEWGQARLALGTTVLRFFAPDHAGQPAVFQITLHPIPYTNKQIAYIAKSVIPSQILLDALKEAATTHRIAYAKFEPHALFEERSLIPAQLKQSSMRLFPDWTQTLDLTPDEQTLMNNLKSKTRYNVRLAMKKGVRIEEETNTQGFNAFFQLYEETELRQHHYGHTKAYHEAVFKHMSPQYSHILIAYYENKPLAAYHLFLHKNTLYYPYGGSTTQNKELMAPNLLMWETITRGKQMGARRFDLWGSLSPQQSEDSTNPWYGFTRFKRGYNTQFERSIGSYDLVIDNLLYPVLTLGWHIRNKWLERF